MGWGAGFGIGRGAAAVGLGLVLGWAFAGLITTGFGAAAALLFVLGLLCAAAEY